MRRLIYVTLVLFVIVITQGQTLVGTYAATMNSKGVMYASDFTVDGEAGAPSFAALKAAHFSMVGTIAYSTFQASDWANLNAWIRSAKSAGFTTFVILNGDGKTFSSAICMAEKVAAMKVDIIILDEMIATYGISEQQLWAGINAIMKVNRAERFIMDEYIPADIQEAYEWTAPYPGIRVATDNYSTQSVIDLGISLASKYGKRAMAWIDFVQAGAATSCYTNLNAWLAYVRGKPVDVLFYYVNADGGWKTNWPTVVNF
jgi:hypothetical protein